MVPGVPATSADPVTTVVGIGADGWSGLSEAARSAVTSADVLFGGQRQLDLVGDVTATKTTWPSPLLAGLDELFASHAGQRICVLASGDPLLSGIGGTLVRRYGTENLRIIPGVSAVTLARARLGWTAEQTETLSAVGRNPSSLRRLLTPGRRVLLLSEDEYTPAVVASLLNAAGYGPSTLTVLEELGGPGERRHDTTAVELAEGSFGKLNIIAIECRPDSTTVSLPTTPGLPDEAFDHDAALTKRTVRAATLAVLAPLPGQLLWDIGSGSGSIAIEWCRAHPANRAVAVERNQLRRDRIAANADRLGATNLRVVEGTAPDACTGLDTPDAVFVGGGLRDGTLPACWDALVPGGTIVANGVTLEAEQQLAAAYADYGGSLSRISVECAEPLGALNGWTPMRTVVQWHARKPERTNTP